MRESHRGNKQASTRIPDARVAFVSRNTRNKTGLATKFAWRARDGSVRIEAADRAGRERPLRYCARPSFALDRLHELGPERLLYEAAEPGCGTAILANL